MFNLEKFKDSKLFHYQFKIFFFVEKMKKIKVKHHVKK